MPHWLIKAAVQRGISLLPKSHKWNEFFQKHVTKSLELTPQRFEARLDFCQQHSEAFSKLQPRRARDFTVVEIGTGWYPVVPVGLYLCGAADIWTYDITPLLSTSRLHRMLDLFGDSARGGNLQKHLPRALPERIARLQELSKNLGSEPPETFLEQLKIHVRVQDAQHTGLNSNSVDLFVSTGVLEYIPRDGLAGILREFKRIGTSEAVMSHYLNLVDEYSYFDSSIGPFNFLKFSSSRWKYFNSPLTWQNRLRISDYRQFFAEAGFQITNEKNTSGTAEDLAKIRIAPEFEKYAREDLLVLISWLAAKSISSKTETRSS